MSEAKANSETLQTCNIDCNDTNNTIPNTNFQDNVMNAIDKGTNNLNQNNYCKKLQSIICKPENPSDNLTDGMLKLSLYSTTQEATEQHLEDNHSGSSSVYFIEEEKYVSCMSKLDSGSVSSNEIWFDAEADNDKNSLQKDLAHNSCHSDENFSPARDFIFNCNPGVSGPINSTFNDGEMCSQYNEGNVSDDYQRNLNSPCSLNFEESADQEYVKPVETSGGIGIHSTHFDTSLSSTLNSVNEISCEMNDSDHVDSTIKVSEQSIEDVDYVCTGCNQVITVYNKDFELSRRRHFEDFHSSSEAIATVEDKMLANSNFFSEVIESLPEALQVHKPYLFLDLSTVFCRLCNCSLDTVQGSVKSSSLVIKSHLIHQYHQKQYALMLKEIMKAPELTKQNTVEISKLNFTCSPTATAVIDPKSTPNTTNYTNSMNNVPSSPIVKARGVVKSCLTPENGCMSTNKNKLDKVEAPHNNSKPKNSYLEAEKYLADNGSSYSGFAHSKSKGNSTIDHVLMTIKELVPTLQDHWKFITRYDSNFLCSLCGRGISYSPCSETLANNFKKHLKVREHFDYMKQLKYNSAAISPQTSTPVSPNKKSVAKISPKTSTPVSPSKKSMFTISPQTSTPVSPPKKTVDSNPKKSSQMEELLKKIAHKNYLITENMHFIKCGKVHFKCRLCNATIMNSPDISTLAENFVSHFRGKNHEYNLIDKEGIKPNTKETGQSEPNRRSTRDMPKSTFCTDPILLEVLGLVPLLKENLKYISRPDFNFYCSFCDRGISYSPCNFTLAKNFRLHFKNHTSHVKYSEYSQNVNSSRNTPTNKEEVVSSSTDGCNLLSQSFDRLRNVVSTSSIIKLNAHCIGYAGINFRCTLCNAIILNSRVNTTLAENFISHFSGYYHSANLDKF